MTFLAFENEEICLSMKGKKNAIGNGRNIDACHFESYRFYLTCKSLATTAMRRIYWKVRELFALDETFVANFIFLKFIIQVQNEYKNAFPNNSH